MDLNFDARPSDELLSRMIAAHGMWKFRLHEAVVTGSSAITVEAASQDDGCPFGQWLYGAGGVLAGQDPYEQIRALHSDFHGLAAQILDLAVQGRADEARAALGPDQAFMAVSAALVVQLDAWRSAGVTVPAARATVEDGPGADWYAEPLLGSSVEAASHAAVASEKLQRASINLGALASTAAELDDAFQEITVGAAAAGEATAAAGAQAQACAAHITLLTDAMGEIDDLLSAMTMTARQTKRLALTAAVGMAPDAGITAVVHKVMELAQRTATAAATVSGHLRDLRTQSSQTAQGVARFAEAIDDARHTQAAITTAVQEQSMATAYLTRSVSDAASANVEIVGNLAAAGLAARTSATNARHLPTA